MVDWLQSPGIPSLLGAVALVVALAVSGHAVLYKRDSRGTMLWIGLIWLIPVIGAALYFAFGINRIRRRTVLRRRNLGHDPDLRGVPPEGADEPDCQLPANVAHLAPLAAVVRKATTRRLLSGNQIEALVDGDETYPAMLDAIIAAKHSIALSTYIFERDEVGMAFAINLKAAVRRGVEVRVLIDATGTFFTRLAILGVLRRNGIRYARFLPAFSLWHPVSLNLRNHRKLLVVDGREGFTGGMNICAPQLRTKRPPEPIEDLHFRVSGPVVAHLQEAFADDWFFTTGEALRGPKWFPTLSPAGLMPVRGIADGPDEDLEKLRWTILGAITAARRSLRILTPYFLPDTAIISALGLAAMRGVEVDILLPSDGDVPFVQWASAAHWGQMLEHGCRIWVAPPPFDHSKIFIVDDGWVLLGSSNWDPRSLRLNFEFNLECYDGGFAQKLASLFDERRRRAHEVSLAEANSRSLAIRLRNGITRLLTPFL